MCRTIGWIRAVAAASVMIASTAHADMFRCMDQSGQVFYSLTKPVVPCYAPPGAGTAKPQPTTKRTAKSSPADFPRVDVATQKARDDMRRQILEAELADEMALQIEAQRVKSAEAAAHHERNIQAIRKEIAYIR